MLWNLQRALEYALVPFDPGIVTLIKTESMFGMPVYRVTCSKYPELQVFYDTAKDCFIRTPDEIYEVICNMAFDAFRNIPALPVGDNIVLGEN